MSDLFPVIPSRSDLDWCWYLRRQGHNGEALERVLHDIGVMHPGGWSDWKSSTMTDTGAPVEMLFSANRSALSLRTEVDNPGQNPSGRMAKVCDLITKFGGGPFPAALRDVIGAAQSVAGLRFGAWLGLRQHARELDMTLYAELPSDTLDLMRLIASARIMPTLERLGDDIRPTRLGYAALREETSLFFETERAPQDVIPDLVGPANVSSVPLLRSLGGMLDTATAVNAGTLKKLGFSYTWRKDGSAPILTLQMSAKDMFGSDAKVAELVRAFPGNHAAPYAVLADLLGSAPRGKTYHGDIGLQARADTSPLFSIGVAAPWHCPFDAI